MQQLEKLKEKRKQIAIIQSKQDETIEKLLLEMQRRQWIHDRGLQEKREVIAAMADL